MCKTEQEKDNQSFLEHLEDLRQTLLKCIYSVAAALPLCFFFAPEILDKLITFLLRGTNVSLNYFSPTEVFMLQIKTALVTALILTFPYISKQLWNFILPALYENEKKTIKSFIFLSAILFISGVIFCLGIILPYIIKFGLSFSSHNIQAVIGISSIVNLALWLSIIFGFMFQIPVITYRLIKNDILEYETIANKRPYIIVILLIISGILTPPDILSQMMLACPTYILFEGGLIFSKLKNKAKKEDECKS